MKNHNRTQFLKQLALLFFGAVFVSVLYAQLDIPTNINNAVQTIQTIVVTDNGRSDGNKVMILNSGGTASALQVFGNMILGSITGSTRNNISGVFSAILGGKNNSIFSNSAASVILGGITNAIYSEYSAIVGSDSSVLTGTHSIILGGGNNKVNGDYSTAGGRNAQANYSNTWVWSDNDGSYLGAPFASTNVGQFLIRAKNGVGINTANPGATLDVNGSFKQGTSYRSVIQLPMPGANVGAGRWYVRLHPSSSVNLASIKVTVQGSWNYAPIMGWLTAEYSYYSPGNGTINTNDFRVTSTEGSAYTSLRIGDLVVENGYISIPVWSSNTNAPVVILEYNDFGIIKDTLTNTSWASSALPAQNFQSIQGNLHVDGNVGIGITSPAAKLDVNGTTRLRGDAQMDANMAIYFGREEGFGGSDFGGADYGFIRWDNDNNSYNYWGDSSENGALVIGSSNDGNNSVSDVVVLKPSSSTIVDSQMIVNGNVGIGITSPVAKLYVAGGGYTANAGSSNQGSYAIGAQSISADASIYSYGAICTSNTAGNCVGSNGVVLGTNNTSAAINIPNAGTTFFNNGGNVGIGTTTPGAKLDVRGSQNNTITSANSVAKFLGNDVGVHFGTLAGTPNYASWIQSMRNSDNAIFPLALQPNGGNVGIGTNDPQSKLHISGAYPLAIGSDGMLKVKSITSAVGTETISLQTSIDGRTDDYTISSYGGDSRHTLALQPQGGYVGIGTTSPGRKLEVVGDIYANGGWLINSGQAGWRNETYGGGWYMVDSSWIRSFGGKNIYQDVGVMRTDGELQVGPSGDRFLVNPSGNVGIGTTNPGDKLAVNGGALFGSSTEKVSILGGGIGFNRKVADGTIFNTAGHGYQFNHTSSTTPGSDYLALQVYSPNGASVTPQALVVKGDGNVGIGTNTPAQKLEVAGTAKLSGLSGKLLLGDNGSLGYANKGSYGQANGVDMGGGDGLYLQTDRGGEGAGIFMNGDTIKMWSPGDYNLLDIYDEDAINGTRPTSTFSIDGVGHIKTPGFWANGNGIVGYSDSLFELGAGGWSNNNGSEVKANAITVYNNGGLNIDTHAGIGYTYSLPDSRYSSFTLYNCGGYYCGYDDNYGSYLEISPSYNDGYTIYADEIYIDYGSMYAYFDTTVANLWRNGVSVLAGYYSDGWYLDGQIGGYSPDGGSTFQGGYSMYYVQNDGSASFVDPSINNSALSISPSSNVSIGSDISHNTSTSLDKLTVNGTIKTSGLWAKGVGVNAGGSYSTAMGANTYANGYISTAIGYNTYAKGDYTTAIGFGAGQTDSYGSIGSYSTSIGYRNLAAGYGSTAIGFQTKASANYSISMGTNTTTTAGANYSLSMGNGANTTAYNSVAIGYGVVANTDGGAAMGKYNSGYTNSLFEVGMGTSTSARANALTVLNDGSVIVAKSIETPKLMVDKLVNRTVSNISVSGQLLPDTSAPATSQTIGSISTGWKELYAGGISAIANGNVGIGTGNPAAKLTVVGNTYLDADWTNDTALRIREGSSDTYGAFFKYGVGDALSIGTRNGSASDVTAMKIGRGSSNVMFNGYINTAISEEYPSDYESDPSHVMVQWNNDGWIRKIPTSELRVGYANYASNAYSAYTSSYADSATSMYNSTYGGGWYMQDSTWLRSNNGKSVWLGGGLLGSDGGLTVGYGGAGYPAGGAIIKNNVGIGLNNPGSKLHVAGITQITDGTAGADTSAYGTFGVTRVADTSNTLSYIAMTRAGNTVKAMGIDPSNNWRFGSPTAGSQYITDASTFMTIKSDGNIGIGTTTPQSKLHVNGSIMTQAGYAINSNIGNYYDLGASKIGAAKSIYSYGSICTQNGGSECESAGGVVLGTVNTSAQTNIPSNGNVFFNNGSNVGIGTNSPSKKLTIQAGHGETQLLLHSLGQNIGNPATEADMMLWASEPGHTYGGVGISNNVYNTTNFPRISTSRGGSYIRLLDNAINFSTVDSAGTTATPLIVGSSTVTVGGNMIAGGYFYSSDITLKKDIKSIDNALTKINSLNGYSFTWKATDKKDIGVIAQEVEKVFPEIVHTNKDGIKSVEYGNLVAPIIEAIKSLTVKIDALFTKYLDQESRINALEQRLQTLEAHK